jgi:two-component system sensor histidine kinase CiaH
VTHNGRRTLWLFAALGAYIIAQFSWWTVLLLRRNTEVANLRALHSTADSNPPTSVTEPAKNLMVMSEAAVFLVILLALLWFTYRALRRDLAQAARQQNFMLAVTHELRTPIASAKLQLQTLGRPGLSDSQRETLLRTAGSELDRLSALTGKVLQAAGSTDAIEPASEVIDVAELVRTMASTARSTYGTNHRIVVLGPSRFEVHADPAALRSILENLLENATKYAPKGTCIEVEMERGDHGWRLLVRDEGPGVSHADRERIFDRFYRAGQEETREQQGTGLGLYIVKRLAQRSGGHVEVLDRQPRGAIFAVAFPSA